MSEPARERERDLDRLLTFVDAIAAIAITLLVLPLVELSAELSDGDSVVALLREHAAEVGAFVLSFTVIARIWLIQHDVVRPLLSGTRRVTTLLLGWSLTIVVLPFPTSLVATSGEQAAVKVLYVGTMIVSILLLTAVQAEIGRRPELTDGSPGTGPAGGLAAAGLLTLALVVMLLLPVTSYLPILLLLAEGPMLRLARRLRPAR